MLEHNGQIVKGKGFCIDDFTTRGMDFIEAGGDKPFFCYFAYNTPHSPMQVPDEYWERFKDNELKLLATSSLSVLRRQRHHRYYCGLESAQHF